MMLETIRFINRLDIQGVKIHMLHIVKNTDLAKLYYENPFHVLTREEYVNIVCDQLELLRPEIVINRITGDPKKDDLIEPDWLLIYRKEETEFILYATATGSHADLFNI